MLAEGTLAPTFKPDRGAEATAPPSEQTNPRERSCEFGGNRSQSVAHVESSRERAQRKKERSSNEDMD